MGGWVEKIRARLRATAASTDPTVRRHRQAWVPKSRVGKLVCWLLAPVLDSHDNYPSAPRLLAWYIALLAIKHEMSASLATPLLATMWGYSAWKDYQAKTTAALTAAQNVAVEIKHDVEEKVTHTITEVRGPCGEPMKSLPPQPDATTPSGDQ